MGEWIWNYVGAPLSILFVVLLFAFAWREAAEADRLRANDAQKSPAKKPRKAKK